MYTPDTVIDIDAFREALRSGSQVEVIAAILNHVEYMIVNQDDWICDGCGDVKHPNHPCDPQLAATYARTKKVSAQTLAEIFTDHRRRPDGTVHSSLVPTTAFDERVVVPTDLEKELALAYERCHKAETKIIELDQMVAQLKSELVRLKEPPKPKPDEQILLVFGNHSTMLFDSPSNLVRWLGKQVGSTVAIRNVEMVCYKDRNYHVTEADTVTLTAFHDAVIAFINRHKDSK